MASDAFAGTTFSFGGAISDVSDIGFSENGNPIDVTDASDTLHVFLAGVKTLEMNVTVFGVPATTVGSTGAITIAWNDGTSDTGGGGTFLCSAKNRSGSVGGAITTQLSFVPLGS